MRKRKQLGLTQSALAELCGLSLKMVQGIEYQEKWPSPESLEKIASALELTAAELFGGAAETLQSDLSMEIVAGLMKTLPGDLAQRLDERSRKAAKKSSTVATPSNGIPLEAMEALLAYDWEAKGSLDRLLAVLNAGKQRSIKTNAR